MGMAAGLVIPLFGNSGTFSNLRKAQAPCVETGRLCKPPLTAFAKMKYTMRCSNVVDNPELELEGQDRAADAVLLYRFDAQSGEHILRLLDPVALSPAREGAQARRLTPELHAQWNQHFLWL